MYEKKYPCRTETISGTTYHVKIWSPAYTSQDQPSMSTSFDSEEQAQRFCAVITEKNPGYRFEISPHNWTQNVCIECGREEY